jgi:hypothetical protein
VLIGNRAESELVSGLCCSQSSPLLEQERGRGEVIHPYSFSYAASIIKACLIVGKLRKGVDYGED